MIDQRGRRRGQEVELKVMLTQLHGHMTVEEELFLNETLSLHNYDISKRELTELGRKYLPGGFQALDPQTLPTHTGGMPIPDALPNKYTTPMAEVQPNRYTAPSPWAVHSRDDLQKFYHGGTEDWGRGKIRSEIT